LIAKTGFADLARSGHPESRMGPADALRLGWADEPISKRMMTAPWDRLTDDPQSFERNGERYRFRESMKTEGGPASQVRRDYRSCPERPF
jgi:hypothetical protein